MTPTSICVNRWVFSRLQLDYRQETQRVKKALMEHGMFECQGGGPYDGNLQVHRSMVNRSIFGFPAFGGFDRGDLSSEATRLCRAGWDALNRTPVYS